MTRPTPPANALTSIADYVQAWNEPDDARRRAVLDSCCADSVTYLDPEKESRGREELCVLAGGLRTRSPAARIEIVGDIACHHTWGCFAWRVVGVDGETLRDGVDTVELDERGRLSRIVGFFGALPF